MMYLAHVYLARSHPSDQCLHLHVFFILRYSEILQKLQSKVKTFFDTKTQNYKVKLPEIPSFPCTETRDLHSHGTAHRRSVEQDTRA